LRRGSFVLFTVASIVTLGSIEYLNNVCPTQGANKTRIDYVDFIDLILLVSIAALTVQMVANSLLQNLTRSLKAEEEFRIQADQLRKANERYQALFEGAFSGLLVLDPDRIVACNETTAKLYGYDNREFVVGHYPWEFSPGELSDGQGSEKMWRSLIEKAFEGERQSFEWKHSKKDGSLFDAEVSLNRVDYGDHSAILASLVDVSEAKRAEMLQDAVYKISQAADKSDTLNMLYEKVHEIIGTVMPADNFYIAIKDEGESDLDFPYFVDELGTSIASEERLRGLTRYVMDTGKSLKCTDAVIRELVEMGKIKLTGRPFAIWIGVPLKAKDKIIGVMVVQNYTNADAYGRRELHMLEYVSEQVAIAIDRKRSEEALRKSEERLLKAQAMAHVGNWELSLPAQGFWGSEEALRMFGLHPDGSLVPYEIISEIVLPEYDATLSQALHRLIFDNIPYDLEFEIRRPNDNEPKTIHAIGERVDDEAGKAVKLVGVVQDITEYKRLEAQIIQAQKMESIGILASGIAHDFNNILGIVLGYSALIERSGGVSDGVLRSAKAITMAGRRAESLVKQMLTFARKNAVSFTSVSLNECIVEVKELVDETFPKTISVVCELGKTLPLITADPTQIHQVLLNLCVNARDAMNGNGILTISTKLVAGKPLQDRFRKAISAQYVVVEVSDTGTGMAEETLKHIFEPFYTTKEPGKGSGMGLAVVFGIMENHGGFIDVKSELGRGARFSLYFPVRLASAENYETQEAPIGISLNGTETIMVVEDEEMLRELTMSILSSHGYQVIPASNGSEAIQVYRSHYDKISLVLSDYGLPNQTGDEVLKAIKSINPEVKFILATGYMDPEERSEILKAGAKDIVSKPYTLDALLTSVRKVLDT